MITHYESVRLATLYTEAFNLPAPDVLPGRDIWPRRPGVFIRNQPVPADAASAEASPARELAVGQFGLAPAWAKSASDAKLRSSKLVNAKPDAVPGSKNFGAAWSESRRCIVPMMAFFVDDWRTGKAVPTRIARVDGRPMGVAGLWERWGKAEGDASDTGEVILSFTLLTVSAYGHGLMHRYQPPGAEKRMPAILNEGAYDAWLNAPQGKAMEFMRAYPANWLTANPVEQS